jgi:molybdopterin synthase catalytic subunit
MMGAAKIWASIDRDAFFRSHQAVRINVKLFAILRDTAGVAELSLDLPTGAKVHDAATALALAHPAIAPHLAHTAYAVNRSYAGPSQVLQEGDELAAIPPVSGG